MTRPKTTIPQCTSGVAFRQFYRLLILGIAILSQNGAVQAQQSVDVVSYFSQASAARGSGLARKTKLVDIRPARPGEIIVTTIRGEGKETQSPPAQLGDKVVRNRCPETGNEQILVAERSFSRRYEGPVGSAGGDGWLPYRPRGIDMRFVVVTPQDGTFDFLAPWGEPMVARPGDLIVQDLQDSKDTYRVAKAAFACTYEVLREP